MLLYHLPHFLGNSLTAPNLTSFARQVLLEPGDAANHGPVAVVALHVVSVPPNHRTMLPPYVQLARHCPLHKLENLSNLQNRIQSEKHENAAITQQEANKEEH